MNARWQSGSLTFKFILRISAQILKFKFPQQIFIIICKHYNKYKSMDSTSKYTQKLIFVLDLD